MEQRYCGKCHKVFAWEIPSQVPYYCPNCYDGYMYHNGNEERTTPPDLFLSFIVLRRMDID